jgi:hypothetical protein
MFKIMGETAPELFAARSPRRGIGAWRVVAHSAVPLRVRETGYPVNPARSHASRGPHAAVLTAVSPAPHAPAISQAGASVPALRCRPRGQFVTRRDRRAPRTWPCRSSHEKQATIPSNPSQRAHLARRAVPSLSARTRRTGRAGAAAAARAAPEPRADPGPARARRGRPETLSLLASGQLGRVQRVTAAHGSRRARARRLLRFPGFRRFIIGVRTFFRISALRAGRQPLQRGALGTLSLPFSFSLLSLHCRRAVNTAAWLCLCGCR